MAVKPKKSCCRDQPRCKCCPIRLLSEGKLDAKAARKIFANDRNRKALKQAAKRGELTKAA